jgi:hypothetical protein
MEDQLTNSTEHADGLLSTRQASGLAQHLEEQEQFQQWPTLTLTNINLTGAVILQNNCPQES